MVETMARIAVRLLIGMMSLWIGWNALGQDGVSLMAATDALLIENDFYAGMVDLAHGGSLTTLNLKEWSEMDILDNFRIQVVIDDDPPISLPDLDDDPEGTWIYHGGPGFPPNPASCHVLLCEPEAAIVRVTAPFREQVNPNDWEPTADSDGVRAEVTYYFFNTRMFFVTWGVHFLMEKEVRRVSIEAIPMAFAGDLYPRHWAYWGANVDDGGSLREGLFAAGWTYVGVKPSDLGERWLDTWGDDLGFGRIILDFDQLAPQSVIQLCAHKPPNIENKRYTGHVDGWIDVPKVESPVLVSEGTIYSATMLYTVHPGDYSYMQTLNQKLLEEIPDLKARLEELRGLEHLFGSRPFASIEDRAAIELIRQLTDRIQAVERAVESEYSAE